MAAFIPDKKARYEFRNKYKTKSKYRKLRDDNKRILYENQILLNEMQNLKLQISKLKANYSLRFENLEADNGLIFRVKPINKIPAHVIDTDVYLAIVAIAKNEGPYLKEWIEYHKIVGVERFYFYDNESDDNTKEVLDPYIKDGTVVYHFLPNHPITKRVPLIEAYNDAIFKYRDRSRWMAMIDIDEFIVPVEKNTVPEFLAEYEQYPAVVANWVNFDSNGYIKRPTAHGGLLTANYTRVRKNHNLNVDSTDMRIKSIVNPRMVLNFVSEHYGLYYRNRLGVTENFHSVLGGTANSHSSLKIRINHYRMKSKEEFIEKLIRNSKGTTNIYKFNEDWLNFPEETIEDQVIQKYVPQLKQALGIKD